MNRWALLRTAVVVGGALFCALSVGLACLDYAGEPRNDCETYRPLGPDAGADDEPECGAALPVATTTGGSGSGS